MTGRSTPQRSGRDKKSFPPEGNEALANDAKDQTHFNAKGAKEMARLVMEKLPVVEPSLKQYERDRRPE